MSRGRGKVLNWCCTRAVYEICASFIGDLDVGNDSLFGAGIVMSANEKLYLSFPCCTVYATSRDNWVFLIKILDLITCQDL